MGQPTPTRNLVRRLLAAVAVGVVVAVVSYLSAFFFLRGMFLSHSVQWMVRQDLKQIAAVVENYKEQKGHYPAHLTDIEGLKDAFHDDVDGQPADRWGHAVQYSATEDGFTLFSFGKDGQPGGEGGDADVYPDRPLELPSFSRFTFDLPTGPIRWACVLTGVGAAVVVGRPHSRGWGDLLIRAVMTTLGAIFIAFIISVVHVPSGH